MEKREATRKKFSQPISFDLLGGKPGKLKNISYQGYGVDISQGGLGMSTETPLQKGKVIRMALPVLGGKATIPVFSIIKWSKPLETQFRVGVQFLS